MVRRDCVQLIGRIFIVKYLRFPFSPPPPTQRYTVRQADCGHFSCKLNKRRPPKGNVGGPWSPAKVRYFQNWRISNREFLCGSRSRFKLSFIRLRGQLAFEIFATISRASSIIDKYRITWLLHYKIGSGITKRPPGPNFRAESLDARLSDWCTIHEDDPTGLGACCLIFPNTLLKSQPYP